MAIDLSVEQDSPLRGRVSHWLRAFSRDRGKSRAADPAIGQPAPAEATPRDRDRDRGRSYGALDPAERELLDVTSRLIADDRYIFVLLKEAAESIERKHTLPAWGALETQMALVPSGTLPVIQCNGKTEPTDVSAYYLDRFAVTNAQFARFVDAGGYESIETWPRDVWPSLVRFTDKTGRPGPASWSNGHYPAELADHPVVGICWYEAAAYARWVGKRLPTAAEWQKAAGWPEQLTSGICKRFPWGDIFVNGRANLWNTGLGRTAAVKEFRSGATLNGIYQLTGNVWEWLDDELTTIPARTDAEMTFKADRTIRRLAGGAFDTYLPVEATNHFVTGQPDLDRRHNIGFRCAVSLSRLRPGP